jgi:hypothetical protein
VNTDHFRTIKPGKSCIVTRLEIIKRSSLDARVLYISQRVSSDVIKKNADTLLDASKEIGLEVNSEKTKYMFMSRHQTAAQSNYIRVANKSFEKVSKFKY